MALYERNASRKTINLWKIKKFFGCGLTAIHTRVLKLLCQKAVDLINLQSAIEASLHIVGNIKFLILTDSLIFFCKCEISYIS